MGCVQENGTTIVIPYDTANIKPGLFPACSCPWGSGRSISQISLGCQFIQQTPKREILFPANVQFLLLIIANHQELVNKGIGSLLRYLLQVVLKNIGILSLLLPSLLRPGNK